jgi:hypothetical protein
MAARSSNGVVSQADFAARAASMAFLTCSASAGVHSATICLWSDGFICVNVDDFVICQDQINKCQVSCSWPISLRFVPDAMGSILEVLLSSPRAL